jgi:hypothetical protein
VRQRVLARAHQQRAKAAPLPEQDVLSTKATNTQFSAGSTNTKHNMLLN